MSNVLQQNPALDKISTRIGRAGSGDLSPILTGFEGKLTLPLSADEVLTSWKFIWAPFGPTDNYNILTGIPAVYDAGTNTWTAEFTFGTHSNADATAAGVRNIVQWTTTITGEAGTYTFQRQFYGKHVPTTGAIYIANQEAVTAEAIVYADLSSGSEAETDEFAGAASLAFNILPIINDEFFAAAEYVKNRYANTRRNWGGAATCEVAVRKAPSGTYVTIISETNIEDIMGYWWDDSSIFPIAYGLHEFRFRLRAKTESATFIDVVAQVRVRQIAC